MLARRRAVGIALLALSLTAATVPGGKPEDVGLSSERLQRINDVITTYIDSGQISGAVTMVSRKGRIAHFEAHGLMDLEDHVGELFASGAPRNKGMGFGLTVEVVMDNVTANRRESNGSFGWDGAFGTHFRVDRKEQLVGLLMVQESNGPLMRDFENAVMQAIVE